MGRGRDRRGPRRPRKLTAELGELASFLGLDGDVSVEPRGDLAPDLALAVARP
ncbi:MAG: hypothetical protein R2746_10510 [Acidimicrobiales bacterium]